MILEKVLIIADARSHVGQGHISRCTALKEIFLKHCIECELKKIDEDSIHNFIVSFVKTIPNNPFQLVIIDSYEIATELELEIKKITNKLLRIIDYPISETKSDILYSYSLSSSDMNNPGYKDLNLIFGLEYTLLRDNFFCANKINKPINDSDNILICFGALDTENYSLQALNEISNNDPKAIFNIITSSVNCKKIKDDVIYQSNSKKINLFSNIDAHVVYDLIINSKLVISSASTIALETCFIGKPLICMPTVENQKYLASSLVEKNVAIVIDNLSQLKNLFSLNEQQKALIVNNQKKIFNLNNQQLIFNTILSSINA